MPRNQMKKIDVESRVYKLKTELYDGQHRDESCEWHDGAHYALGKVLEMLQEYRE